MKIHPKPIHPKPIYKLRTQLKQKWTMPADISGWYFGNIMGDFTNFGWYEQKWYGPFFT